MTKMENLMEVVLEEYYERMKDQLECCSCELCKRDIIMVALNRLPSKYTSTDVGKAVSRANIKAHEMELVAALHYAAGVVNANPRH